MGRAKASKAELGRKTTLGKDMATVSSALKAAKSVKNSSVSTATYVTPKTGNHSRDLRPDSGKPKCWEGVRNAQAKNYMKSMQVGDQAFFYHSSNGKDTGIFGIARINREAYPDPTSFDKNSKYYDNKTSPANPKWFMVDLELVEEWGGAPLRLEEMKALKDDPDRKEAQAALSGMPLLQKGNRLSVQPVTAGQWDFICSLNAQKRKV